MKSIEFEIPAGYQLNVKKTTENKVVLTPRKSKIWWVEQFAAIAISDEGENFLLPTMYPAFFCKWDETRKAARMMSYAPCYGIHSLEMSVPTQKQLALIQKYLYKINDLINKAGTHPIIPMGYWCKEEIDKDRALEFVIGSKPRTETVEKFMPLCVRLITTYKSAEALKKL